MEKMELKQNMLKEFLEKLKSTQISLDNFEVMDEKVRNNVEIIETQIETNIQTFNDAIEKIENIKKTENYKNNESDGLIPIEVLNLYKNLIDSLQNSYTLITMKSILFNSLSDKKSETLEIQKGMTVKQDTLREMREMDKQQREFLTTLFTDKYKQLDEKYLTHLDLMRRENSFDRKEQLSIIEKMLKVICDSNKVNKKDKDDVEKMISNVPNKVEKKIKDDDEKIKTQEKEEEINNMDETQDENEDNEDDIEITEHDKLSDIESSFKQL